jgi:hypothetical protein
MSNPIYGITVATPISPTKFSGADISTDLGKAAHLEAYEKFIAKMNEKATQLGMTNTVYKTPSGLCRKPISINSKDDTFTTKYNSYTTAYDLLRQMVAVRHTPAVYTAMGNKSYTYYKNSVASRATHLNLNHTKWITWQKENGYTIRAMKGGSLEGAYSEFGGDPIMNFVFIIQSSEGTYAVAVMGLISDVEYEILRTLAHDLIDMANGHDATQAILDASRRTYPVGMAVAKLTGGSFDDDMDALKNGKYYNEHTRYVAASLAKIMTALVAVRYIGNNDCSVNYNDNVGGSAIAGFKVGDTTNTTDALNLVLVVSDNMLATMLARICGERISVGNSEDVNAPRDSIVLIDQNTGASYQIFVVDGKLTMMEVE